MIFEIVVKKEKKINKLFTYILYERTIFVSIFAHIDCMIYLLLLFHAIRPVLLFGHFTLW